MCLDLFLGISPDTFKAYGGLLDFFGMGNTNIPTKNYNQAITENAQKSGAHLTSVGGQIDWLKGAAGNTGSFFNWLGSTTTKGMEGANPARWLKGAVGNTGSFFNWLGKTSTQRSYGGLGNINSSLGWLGKTATQGLGGTNPLGWLKGAAGNTGGFFNWLGNTASTGSIGGWKDFVGGFTGAEKGAGSWLKGAAGNTGDWLKGLLPGASSAAGSGGKQSIWSDITGKNGLLDFSRFIPKFTWPKISFSGIGDWIKSKIPQIKWPNISLSGIGQWIQSKIPKLSWPNLSGIDNWIQSKIPKLNWKIPTLSDVKNFVWGKITSLNWKIPTLDDVKGWVWGKINPLSWSLPSVGEILTAIEHHIHDFVWPSGPGGVITGVVHRAESNFSNAMAQRSQAQAQSTTNAKSYVQTSDFKQRMNTRWGGLIGRGPSGPRENKRNLKNMFSGFGYEDYEGSKKSIWQTLKDGAANCFDLSLAEMFMAGNMGLNSELVWSTWNGGSHV
ncbi:MAG: hypothetical protein K8E24_015950, partial [Methanobacterium paludis]|nr:hypothetical protein [Methanobacterium paludis]